MKYLILTLLISFSCYAQMDEIVKYEEFDSWLYSSFQNSDFESKESLIQLGEPVSKKLSPYEIGHSPEEMESFEYTYPGLLLCGIQQKNGNRLWISKVVVTDSRWSFGEGIRVGENISKLNKLAVQPENSNTLKFCGLNNCLKFDITNRLISRIELTLYVD